MTLVRVRRRGFRRNVRRGDQVRYGANSSGWVARRSARYLWISNEPPRTFLSVDWLATEQLLALQRSFAMVNLVNREYQRPWR